MKLKTLKEFTESWYLPQYVETSAMQPGTRVKIYQSLGKYILPLFGEIPLEEFTAKHWKVFENHLREHGKVGNKTIKNHQSILRRILNVAVEDGDLAGFPRIKSAKVVQAAIHALTQDEQRAMVASAQLEPDPKWTAMLMIALQTGMRIGELRGLEWKHIITEDEGKRFHIVQSVPGRKDAIGPTKTGHSRKVALNAVSEGLLQGLHARTHSCRFLFGKPDKSLAPPTYKACHKAIERIRTRAKVADCGWHTLRHTVATRLAHQGKLSIVAIKDLLGHVDIRTTMRYVQVDPSTLNATTAALENF